MAGETLRGPLDFYWEEDVVVLTIGGQSRTLPAAQVVAFQTEGQQTDLLDLRSEYDFELMRQGYYPGNPAFADTPKRLPPMERAVTGHHVFGAYRWNRGNEYSDFRVPAYFEHLSTGPIVLLYRPALAVNSQQQFGGLFYNTGVPDFKRVVEKNKFYLGFQNGKTIELRDPKATLLACFQGYAEQIEEFAKQHKLSFKKPHELAYLVNYANALANGKQP